MKVLPLSFSLVMFAITTPTNAQTKISGTAQCSEPHDTHTISIEQSANHSFAVSQAKCTWIKPMKIGGVQNKDGISTDMYEVNGTARRGRAFFVDTMANGDKIYYRAVWLVTGWNQGDALKGKWTWKFVGGTGKFKALRGKGVCNFRAASSTWECEGEYELPR